MDEDRKTLVLLGCLALLILLFVGYVFLRA